ncbi:MAG: VOC family protein [Chloroflexi bacterium]|nr:VOC family protein [Chloroflexota bacterium]
MRFNSVCIITRDVAKLRDFYTTILGVKAEGDDTFTTLLTEGTPLTLYTEQGMEEMAPGCMEDTGYGRCVLEFEVNDVDQEYERLKSRNVVVVKLPTTQPWGVRSVWFRDPDRNLINFYARVG